MYERSGLDEGRSRALVEIQVTRDMPMGEKLHAYVSIFFFAIIAGYRLIERSDDSLQSYSFGLSQQDVMRDRIETIRSILHELELTDESPFSNGSFCSDNVTVERLPN